MVRLFGVLHPVATVNDGSLRFPLVVHFDRILVNKRLDIDSVPVLVDRQFLLRVIEPFGQLAKDKSVVTDVDDRLCHTAKTQYPVVRR